MLVFLGMSESKAKWVIFVILKHTHTYSQSHKISSFEQSIYKQKAEKRQKQICVSSVVCYDNHPRVFVCLRVSRLAWCAVSVD